MHTQTTVIAADEVDVVMDLERRNKRVRACEHSLMGADVSHLNAMDLSVIGVRDGVLSEA